MKCTTRWREDIFQEYSELILNGGGPPSSCLHPLARLSIEQGLLISFYEDDMLPFLIRSSIIHWVQSTKISSSRRHWHELFHHCIFNTVRRPQLVLPPLIYTLLLFRIWLRMTESFGCACQKKIIKLAAPVKRTFYIRYINITSQGR